MTGPCTASRRQLGSLESPCSGLYRRKKSSPIESLDPEIFTFKVEALWKAFDLVDKSAHMQSQVMTTFLEKNGVCFEKKNTVQVDREDAITIFDYTIRVSKLNDQIFLKKLGKMQFLIIEL
ncbi:unnamed protein product [Rhizophagus irregularis]|nr:unnamed protein product [Rhizophagus irregularis]